MLGFFSGNLFNKMVKLSAVSKCFAKGKGQCKYQIHKMRFYKKKMLLKVEVQYKEDLIQGTIIIGHKKGPIQHLFERVNNFVTLFFYYGFANTLFAVLYYIFSFVIEKYIFTSFRPTLSYSLNSS